MAMLLTYRISIIAMMTAACVSTNYLLVGLINVKLMDLIVFISGFAFGPLVGVSVGTLTWLVYGTLNPYGFSFPILIATCLGEAMYGLVGGLLNKGKFMEDFQIKKNSVLVNGIKFAVIGFLLTFVYDLFTNIVSGVIAGLPMFLVLAAGIPFAIIHEVSNTVFFFMGVSPLMHGINRLRTGTSLTNMVKK